MNAGLAKWSIRAQRDLPSFYFSESNSEMECARGTNPESLKKKQYSKFDPAKEICVMILLLIDMKDLYFVTSSVLIA
jgi:hypothetical protein